MPWLTCVVSNVLLTSLLAVIALFVQRRMRRNALAHILWVLVLVKLVTPPLVSVPLGESPGKTACMQSNCLCGQHSPTVARGTLPWVLLAAWSAGAGATAWTAWRRWTRFRNLLVHAVPAPLEWQTLAAHLATELSLRRPVEVLAIPGRLPPLVFACRHGSRLLLPMALMNRLGASQREALLLHELVHIQRGDHFVRLLELAVGVVYWWLPFIASIGRQLRVCEEKCCDEAVVAHLPHARREYARLLLDVLDFASPLPPRTLPQATAMSSANDLEQRLRTILDATQGTRRTWPARALAVGLACAIVPFNLQYEFTGRPAPAATSAVLEPAAGCLPDRVRSLELCCPS